MITSTLSLIGSLVSFAIAVNAPNAYLKTLAYSSGASFSLIGLKTNENTILDPILPFFDFQASNFSKPDDWLKKCVFEGFHFRVNGETGSGKSTFASNLITLAKNLLGGKVDCILVDPKYPLSDWDISPQFKGIEQGLEGLKALAKIVEDRLEQAKITKAQGTILSFPPLLFVIDEIDWIVSEFGKEATKLLKVGLKVGRALNVKILYLGQSPLCDDLGLRKNDFKHSCNFFLGENALPGLDEVCYTSQQKKTLKEDFLLLQQQTKYLALVKPIGQSPFIAQLPKPNAYGSIKKQPQLPAHSQQQPHQPHNTKQWLETLLCLECAEPATQPQQPQNIKNTLKCPHCDSNSFKKNGTYKKNPRYMCKSCGKTWTEVS